MKTLTLLTLGLSLTLLACGGEDPATAERGVISDPGPVKADGTNSCKASCGGQAPSGCWCDELCTGFGDCCPDYQARCVSTLTCANVKCAAGTHCELKGINGGAVPVCIKDPITTCANLKCAAGYHCELKGINGGAVPVCIKDPLITCANLKCAAGYHCDDTIVDGKVVGCVPDASCLAVLCAPGTHCELKGLNGGSPVPVCVKDPTCAELGGSCLPLTYPMGACASDEIADDSAGLCPALLGSTTTCCRKDPDCAALNCPASYHCELKGLNGGSPVPVCIKNS
jgi:hypothetical protein